MNDEAQTSDEIGNAAEAVDRDAPASQRLVASLALGAVVIAIGAGLLTLLIRLSPEPERSQREPPRPRVDTAAAELSTEPLHWRGHGVVQPRQILTIRAEVSGRIAADSQPLRIGQEIAAGASALRIDSETVRREHASAEASVAEAEARIAEREATHRSDQRQLDIERQRLAIAERLLEAERELFDQGGTSQRQVDLREQEQLRAAAAVAQLEAAIELHQPRLRALRANLDRAQALRIEAESRLAKTDLVAPWPAVVSAVAVEPGDAVAPGQHLATLIQRGEREVEVSIRPGILVLLTGAAAPPVGEFATPLTAMVGIDHGSGVREERPARLVRSEPALRPGTRELLVSGPIADNDAPPLHRESFAEVIVEGRTLEALRIPAEAVLDDGSLWVVVDGRLERRRPRIVFEEGERVVIASDSDALRAGERVVTTALEDAFDGMAVAIDSDRDDP